MTCKTSNNVRIIVIILGYEYVTLIVPIKLNLLMEKFELITKESTSHIYDGVICHISVGASS